MERRQRDSLPSQRFFEKKLPRAEWQRGQVLLHAGEDALQEPRPRFLGDVEVVDEVPDLRPRPRNGVTSVLRLGQPLLRERHKERSNGLLTTVLRDLEQEPVGHEPATLLVGESARGKIHEVEAAALRRDELLLELERLAVASRGDDLEGAEGLMHQLERPPPADLVRTAVILAPRVTHVVRDLVRHEVEVTTPLLDVAEVQLCRALERAFDGLRSIAAASGLDLGDGGLEDLCASLAGHDPAHVLEEAGAVAVVREEDRSERAQAGQDLVDRHEVAGARTQASCDLLVASGVVHERQVALGRHLGRRGRELVARERQVDGLLALDSGLGVRSRRLDGGAPRARGHALGACLLGLLPLLLVRRSQMLGDGSVACVILVRWITHRFLRLVCVQKGTIPSLWHSCLHTSDK